MKEPYIKGEAAPLWPRVMRRYSARMRRSVDRGSVGQPLSSEITTIRVPTAWSGWEGNTGSGINQLATPRPCGVVRTCACVDALCSRTGRSQRSPASSAEAGAVGEGLWLYFQHVRHWEVRHQHSTWEGAEQCCFIPRQQRRFWREGRWPRGISEEYACDLYPETGANIAWTWQDTCSSEGTSGYASVDPR